jgi:hypothetical protein
MDQNIGILSGAETCQERKVDEDGHNKEQDL